jgi:hypothetical protein
MVSWSMEELIKSRFRHLKCAKAWLLARYRPLKYQRSIKELATRLGGQTEGSGNAQKVTLEPAC